MKKILWLSISILLLFFIYGYRDDAGIAVKKLECAVKGGEL